MSSLLPEYELAIRGTVFEKVELNIVNQLVNNGINWEKYTKICIQHGLSGFIYKSTINNYVPDKVMQGFKSIYYKTILNNINHDRALTEAKEVAQANKIDIVLLKGIALLKTVFKTDTGLRGMGDLDVFVNIDKAADFYQLLQSKGYKIIENRMENNTFKMENLHSYDTLQKAGVQIDLHFNLESYRKNSEDFIACFKQNLIRFDDYVWLPDNEFHALFLINHFYRHIVSNKSFRINSLLDIVLVIQSKQKFDWKRFDNIAYRFFDIDFTKDVLLFLKTYYNIDIQSSIVDSNSKISDKFYHLLQNTYREHKKGFKKLAYKLHQIKGFNNKLIYIRYLVFPTSRYIRKYYDLNRKTKIFRYYLKYWKFTFFQK